MKTTVRIAATMAVLLLAPAGAGAQWVVSPLVALNTGGDTTRESLAVGVSGGWLGRWYGAEAEAVWSPMFFDDDGGFRTRRRSSTYTGTALVGPQFGRLRPYGAIGAGVLRSEIAEVGGLATLTDNRAALHAGGGAMWSWSDRLGVRGDVRYIRALDDTEPAENVFPERLAEFQHWRIGGGVTFRW